MAGGYRLRRGYIRLAGFLGLLNPEVPIRISPVIQPTLDLFPLSSYETNEAGSYSVAGNGFASLLTVPTGEMWRLRHIALTKDSGAFEVDLLVLTSALAGADQVIEMGIGLTTSTRHIHGPVDYWLYPGDSIRLTVINYVSVGAVSGQVRFQKMDYDVEGGEYV